MDYLSFHDYFTGGLADLGVNLMSLFGTLLSVAVGFFVFFWGFRLLRKYLRGRKIG